MTKLLATGVQSEYFSLAKAYIPLNARGDTAPVRAYLDGIPKPRNPASRITIARWQVALMDRNFDRAYAVLSDDSREAYEGGAEIILYPRSYLDGLVAHAAGEAERARAAFEEALPIVQKQLEDDPTNPGTHYLLARIYAGLTDKDRALVEAAHIVRLAPLAKNYQAGADFRFRLAVIYAWMHNAESAVRTLESLLKIPCADLNYGELKLNPDWDGIRDDSGFQRLLNKLAPKMN